MRKTKKKRTMKTETERSKKSPAAKIIIAVFVLLLLIAAGFGLYFCHAVYHQFPWEPHWENRINYRKIDKGLDKCAEIAQSSAGLLSGIGSVRLSNADDGAAFQQELADIGLSGQLSDTTPGIVLFYYDYTPETDTGICYIEDMNDVQYFFGKPYYNTSPVREVYKFEPVGSGLYVYARVAEFH